MIFLKTSTEEIIGREEFKSEATTENEDCSLPIISEATAL